MRIRLSGLEWLFSLGTALVGISLVWAATSKYGAGVSSDSIFYLASADSFAQGKGLLDHEGFPYILWPPLYPVLLGGLQWVTGLPALALGRLLNAALRLLYHR